MVGLYVFFYACVHFSTWLVFDHFFDIREIVKDIIKRPYITVGFLAFVMLIPLAVTSTNRWMKRLGAAASAGLYDRHGRRAALLVAGEGRHAGPNHLRPDLGGVVGLPCLDNARGVARDTARASTSGDRCVRVVLFLEFHRKSASAIHLPCNKRAIHTTSSVTTIRCVNTDHSPPGES